MPETVRVYLSFNQTGSELLEVTRVGKNTLRLEESPLSDDEYGISTGDLIEVCPIDFAASAPEKVNPSYRFIRIVEKAKYDRYSWVLPIDIINSSEMKGLKRTVEAAGGAWEIAFNGLFIARLPNGSGFDPQAALDEVVRAVERNKQISD